MRFEIREDSTGIKPVKLVRVQTKAPVLGDSIASVQIIKHVAPTLELPFSIPTLPYYNNMQAINRITSDEDGEESDEEDIINNSVYNLVYVVGCGGTGGYVVRDLARYLATLPYAKHIIMVLIDGDEVEQRNLIRQNFITKDIGKNKAEVLAQRYGAAYGIRMTSIPTHLTKESIDNILSETAIGQLIQMEGGLQFNTGSTPLVNINLCIVSCVDNNKTRALISESLGLSINGTQDPIGFMQHVYAKERTDVERPKINSFISTISWVDSGNETSAGQVIVYYDSLFAFGNAITGYLAQHGLWQWDGNGGLNIGSSCFLNPTGARTPSSIRYMRLFEYIKHLTVDGFVKNFQGRNAYNPKYTAAVKMARGFDPFAGNALTQAKFIQGMMASMGNGALCGYFTFPITWVYPDVLLGADDKTNLEMSCTERATADPQNLMVNIQAASNVVQYVSKIFASNPKTAFLDSYGCAWNGPQCIDYKLTKSNIAKILNPDNMKRAYTNQALWR
jgi:molybdopterin/thiamine biosynthesis adenylyltransferase